jgi:hypothetical protein
MASDVMSLFSMPTQEQLGQQYLQGLMTSPAQMGSQGLLQQVVSLGGNAGAGLGYGVGRLLGGMTAEEVRAKGINDAMQTVQGMGLTSDAEMYGALSQELARRGLTQDALLARNTALKAAQTEQGMRTEQARVGIAQEELGLRKAADAREAEMLPVKIDALKSEIFTRQEKLKPTQQKLAEAAAEVERLSVEKPNSPELRAALGRYQGYAEELAQANREIAFKERELDIRSRQAGASETQAQAAMSRAEAMANQESYTQQVKVADLMGQQQTIGYYSPKLGKFKANDGSVFNTRAEMEAYVKQQAPTSTIVTPKGGTANWRAFLPQQPQQ